LVQQWAEYPPTHVLLKALLEGLGGKRRSSSTPVKSAEAPVSGPRETTPQEFQELVGLMGGVAIGKGVKV
jgi:hypothetical protein